MRYLLFPFRWLDEQVQKAVDASAFRLRRRLRCDLRVLKLMLALVTVVSYLPFAFAILVGGMSILTKAMVAAYLVVGGRDLLALPEDKDRSIHPWRFYVLARAMVAFMKMVIIAGFAFLATATFSNSALGPTVAAGLTMTGLSLLASIYLQRTPTALPEEAVSASLSSPAPT